MKIETIAAQLYSVRDFIKTPTEVAASLKRIRKIGYRAVQISGMGPIEPAELTKMLDGEGLVCAATHESGHTILNEPQKVVDRLNALGCSYTAYPYPGDINFSDAAAVATLIKKLDHAGKVLNANGKVLTYHNHQIEFRKLKGQIVLDMIYAKTNPRHLQAELDTYWVQVGGGDPTAWCEKMKNRLPLLHLKDYGLDAENRPVFREIGQGNLDFKRILTAAKRSGCKWFIVEQDSNWTNNDPFESLKISFRYLQKLCPAV